MTDAEVRDLSESFRLLKCEGSLSPSMCKRVVAIAEDYLALKAAVRTVYLTQSVSGKWSQEPMIEELYKAKALLEKVAKEHPHA